MLRQEETEVRAPPMRGPARGQRKSCESELGAHLDSVLGEEERSIDPASAHARGCRRYRRACQLLRQGPPKSLQTAGLAWR